MQMFSELRGTTQTELHSPKFYIPEPLPIMANHEVQQLEEIAPTIIKELDNISSRVSTNPGHRHTIPRTSYCTAPTESTTLAFHYCYFYFHNCNFRSPVSLFIHLSPWFYLSLPKPNDFIRPTLPTNTDLPQQAAKLNDEGPEQTIKFVSYPTKHAD